MLAERCQALPRCGESAINNRGDSRNREPLLWGVL